MVWTRYSSFCRTNIFIITVIFAGDRAANYSDLGYHMKEDMCCREHDNCPKYLMKGECREGICNNSPYTRLLSKYFNKTKEAIILFF